MKARVIVNGAQGKMGSLACEAIDKHPQFDLVAQLGKNDNLTLTIDKLKADIVVDLTRADSVYENTLTIIHAGARPVIGTTGLSSTQINELVSLCEQRQLGGVIAPNFSIGAILMMRFASLAAEYFSEVEIIEMHHQTKQDAPSGTAIKTAEMIAANQKVPKNILDLKDLIIGVRGGTHHDIPIHSVRLPGILANQEVIFGGEGETLSIKHNTVDRSCFMPGILLACQKVLALKTLIYGLDQLMP